MPPSLWTGSWSCRCRTSPLASIGKYMPEVRAAANLWLPTGKGATPWILGAVATRRQGLYTPYDYSDCRIAEHHLPRCCALAGPARPRPRVNGTATLASPDVMRLVGDEGYDLSCATLYAL